MSEPVILYHDDGPTVMLEPEPAASVWRLRLLDEAQHEDEGHSVPLDSTQLVQLAEELMRCALRTGRPVQSEHGATAPQEGAALVRACLRVLEPLHMHADEAEPF